MPSKKSRVHGPLHQNLLEHPDGLDDCIDIIQGCMSVANIPIWNMMPKEEAQQWANLFENAPDMLAGLLKLEEWGWLNPHGCMTDNQQKVCTALKATIAKAQSIKDQYPLDPKTEFDLMCKVEEAVSKIEDQ